MIERILSGQFADGIGVCGVHCEISGNLVAIGFLIIEDATKETEAKVLGESGQSYRLTVPDKKTETDLSLEIERIEHVEI